MQILPATFCTYVHACCRGGTEVIKFCDNIYRRVAGVWGMMGGAWKFHPPKREEVWWCIKWLTTHLNTNHITVKLHGFQDNLWSTSHHDSCAVSWISEGYGSEGCTTLFCNKWLLLMCFHSYDNQLHPWFHNCCLDIIIACDSSQYCTGILGYCLIIMIFKKTIYSN